LHDLLKSEGLEKHKGKGRSICFDQATGLYIIGNGFSAATKLRTIKTMLTKLKLKTSTENIDSTRFILKEIT